MDKKILRTLAVLTVGFGLNAATSNNAAAEMTSRGVPVQTTSPNTLDKKTNHQCWFIPRCETDNGDTSCWHERVCN